MSKTFYNEVYRSDHPSKYDGGVEGMPKRILKLWNLTESWLKNSGVFFNCDAEILEIGCGMAYLAKIHPRWNGAEYSRTAVERVKQRDGNNINVSEQDAQNLSYKDGSFDAIFSFATFEHVPNPNKAFEEIDRVLRPGGEAMLAPAWHCRSWTVKKIEVIPWSELFFMQKIERLLIPVRASLIFRALVAAPRRLIVELKMSITTEPLTLSYRSLYPRWDLIEKYGHVSDDDAVADIDAHAGIAFFKSRGYSVLSHPTLLARLLARGEAVIVRKSLQV